MTFNNAGILYGAGYNGLYTVDMGTGAASLVAIIDFYTSGDIAFDSSGNLSMSATGSTGDSLISLDAMTGVGTYIGSIGDSAVYGLSYSGSTLYGFQHPVKGSTISVELCIKIMTQIFF